MKPGGFTPLLLGGRINALQTRERRAIAMYVTYSDLNSDRYTHCCPYQSVLSDLQGKKEIAATTTNSDGLPMPSHR